MAVLRSKIMEMRGDIDPRLIAILMGLEEENIALRGTVGELGRLVNNLADLMGSQQVVLDKMKPIYKQLKDAGVAVGTDPSITGEYDDRD